MKTPKVGQKVTLHKKGKKPITFKKGGLHESLGVPQGKEISPKKMSSALKGEYGLKAKKQAQFKKNVLVGRKK